MDLSLESKVIIVTGGAQGIGAAIVRFCAKEGAIPVILDRDENAIQELQLELNQKGLTSEAVVVELIDHENTRRVTEEIGRKFGHIDGLVNNAGVNDGVGLENGSPEKFAISLKRNLFHYYSMTHSVTPFLQKSHGCIVNIASKVAVTGQGGTSGYAAAKGAILELTIDWARKLSSHGIRVNAVVPAEVMTPQYEKWLNNFKDPQGQLRSIAGKVPLGHRFTDVDEIAATTAFLLSAKSGSITGQQVFVDGGYAHLDRGLT